MNSNASFQRQSVLNVESESISEGAALAALSYASAVYALFFNVQPVLVGVLQKQFGFDEAQLGGIVSAGFFSACGVLGTAYFWVRFVPWRLGISAGVLIALAGLSISFFAQGYVEVVLGMMLLGAGFAAIAAPVVLALGATANPTRSFGCAVTAQVLLASVCVYLIPVVIYPNQGFSAVIGFLMILVLALLPLVRFVPQGQIQASSTTRAGRGGRWAGWLALAAMTIYFLGLNGNWAFLELLGERGGLTTESIGLTISVALVIGAAGSLAASAVHTRLSVWQAMTGALFGFVIYVFTMGINGVIAYAGAVIVFNIVWNFSLPYQMDVIARSDHNGRLLALLPAAQALGGALGPLSAGSLLLMVGPAGLYLQLLVCVVMAVIGFSLIDRRVR